MKTATIKATGEKINVYLIHSNGKWHDGDAIGDSDIPTSKLGKKEFDEKELIFDNATNN